MTDTLSIQDFSRLDLRVGRITEVADHPNADKLYVMQCDLGPDLGTRQLVAGLKPYMPPEALKDKLVVVVANLEPATLRGQRSEGMLLAAQDGQKVVILTTAEAVATGSKVR
jgi:methionyl-tRNA synthetase